ncbi:D-alanyl-D-alanine carboxypeptidase [Arenicella chitinivorans]|uniref:D-alanyl-D-alanine carboxypeptidase n=1 Tax=Arenicella chitinivorans TaxID=1329800 RepID=A0A918RPQ2_9GAMM|nr:D-alanyl-D-alanine carboxypeptidase [Arenicella chitinivorans]GHA05784.1 D-alanyl-D-alanine carboxypeptidase [Arenicella chitinivorans]
MMRGCLVCIVLTCFFVAANVDAARFKSHELTDQDAVLVLDADDATLFDWRSEQPLIPASLTKLVTAYLAMEKWGASHQFRTAFYYQDQTLWIQGFGDPYLVSEEIEHIAAALVAREVADVKTIRTDSHFFDLEAIPGRSRVDDPYNAPLAALSANFNTVMLQRHGQQVVSAEPQTPLTPLAEAFGAKVGTKVSRINLISAQNAQRYFAELLAAKAGWSSPKIEVDQRVPSGLKAAYVHVNSRNLAETLRGALEYSNNVIANHLFLKLAETPESQQVSFEVAVTAAETRLKSQFGWSNFVMRDGAGLTRDNRFSARQLAQILGEFQVHRHLLKPYLTQRDDVRVYAKTGTLDGVHSFAGYIELDQRPLRFVFIFNRPMPYQFRQHLLRDLVTALQAGTLRSEVR